MIYKFESYSLDVDRQELRHGADLVGVEPQVLDLLHYLIRNRERVVSKDDLIANVWNGRIVSDSTLTSRITSARQAVGDSGDYQRLIRTIARKGIRFVGEVKEELEPITGDMAKPTLLLPDKPSIAVLPFVNLSGDPEQEYFSDGVTEDLTTALARFRWFFVIGRSSSFVYKGKIIDVKQIARELGVRYLLQGSVRKSAGRVRITAQLIDASTSNHIWAEHYDHDLTNIFAVQDEITDRVAGAIEPELLRAEGGHLPTSIVHSLTAWDLVRKGIWHFHQFTSPTFSRARELFREAVEQDSRLSDAYAWLGRVNAGLVGYGWSDHPASDLREGIEAALKAVQLDDKNPYAHFALGVTSLFSGTLSQSVRAAEKVIEISPSFALGHALLGTARLFSGKAADAIEPLERGLRLSPYDPQNFIWMRMLALAFYFTEQTERAFQSAVQALKVRPAFQPTLETVVICCVATGRMEEARVFAEQMHRLDRPNADWLAQLKVNNPQWSERMAAMLRKARS